MKTLIAIPVMGSYEIGRIALYQFDRTASPDAHFLLIDNGGPASQYPALFDRGFLDPNRWSYHANDSNIGLVASCQQAYNFALGMDADILVLTHNDVWLYPEMSMQTDNYDEDIGIAATPWDESIDFLFNNGDAYCIAGIDRGNREYANLGVIGLFGSKGCGREGHRLDTFGSLIEIAGHGRKMTEWIEPAVCLDGFFLACSMKMLREAGGFDQRYEWHHVYDYDISLTSIELGYRNAVINIPCHHLSGLTANNAAFATSGPDVHTANYERWKAKWSAKLGLTVNENWEYAWRVGQ